MTKQTAGLLLWVIALFTCGLLACQPKVLPISAAKHQNLSVENQTGSVYDSVQRLISPYREELQREMSEILGVLPTPLEHRSPSSPLGNWVCDLLRQASDTLFSGEIDAVIYNQGGLRRPSLSDTLSVRDIYELVPFDNYLVVVELDGRSLQTWAEWIVERGGWPVSHSLEIRKSAEGRVLVSLDQRQIHPEGRYRIATNDYIANGGDQCHFLEDQARENSGLLVRDLLIRAIRADGMNHIDGAQESRIRISSSDE